MNTRKYGFFLNLEVAPWYAIASKGARCCLIAAVVLQRLVFSVKSTLAQALKPVADNKLGVESSVVTPIANNINIRIGKLTVRDEDKIPKAK
ncbi:hypothetical protein F7734_30425 [Scytonema sp. UIC 10036]|uniref:hypothetical protein n=1 Tax=Scytonema sp. UIC 10036 TaxID=2304196 RepID=UPI0012DA8A0F|nr:hypothetical protein [Scytonema sp. UIC 10036]MUG96429.1 hypothetical protein [Scytonema sp. UIC 10036]